MLLLGKSNNIHHTTNQELLLQLPLKYSGGSCGGAICQGFSNILMDGEPKSSEKLSQDRMYSWYFSREEIEKFSPSRKDGISENKEAEIRHLYCSFIRDVGIRLKLPQMTIATAIMFCHRFYLHQSLAKNGWQTNWVATYSYNLSKFDILDGSPYNTNSRTVATVCVFLASKVEDTPCPLDLVVRVAYEMMYRRDSAAAQRIRQKDVFEKQKAHILIGERLVLTTIRFDFNIQHPYRSLLDAIKNLGIIQKEVKQMAWNFVNDWIKTTLCLQYKPQYIAAGSLYLAAKLHNIKLPLHGAHVWWHQFDVAPKPLEAVIQQMMELVALKKSMPAHPSPVKQKDAQYEAKLLASNSPDSVLNQSSLSINSSSPDFTESSDHMQVDSGQDSVSSHIDGGTNAHPNRNLLIVGANRIDSSNEHDVESLDQSSIAKRGDGMISSSHQNSLYANVAAESGTDGVHGSSLNQSSRSWQGDGVNTLPGNVLLDAGVDCESTQDLGPPIENTTSHSDCLNVDSFCSDQRLSSAAADSMDVTKVDHLSLELRKVDVARIKNLLMKKKMQIDTREQEIASDDLSEEAWIERELESGIVTKREAERAAISDDSSDEAWIERELESGIVIEPRKDRKATLDGLSEDDWIERELESGIIIEAAPPSKKQRVESRGC
ncbi:hypothetical protein ACP4OV_006550 [Aristida adscensionis]